jgi:preprotein translocase subunit Sec63
MCEAKIAVYERFMTRRQQAGDLDAVKIMRRFAEIGDDYRDYDDEVEEGEESD